MCPDTLWAREVKGKGKREGEEEGREGEEEYIEMREGRFGSKRDGEQVRRGWDGRGGLGRKGKDGEAGKWGEDIIAFVSHCLRPVFFVGGQVEVMLRLLRSFVCQIQVNKRSIYLCTRLSCVRLPLSLALFSFSFLSFLSFITSLFSFYFSLSIFS